MKKYICTQSPNDIYRLYKCGWSRSYFHTFFYGYTWDCTILPVSKTGVEHLVSLCSDYRMSKSVSICFPYVQRTSTSNKTACDKTNAISDNSTGSFGRFLFKSRIPNSMRTEKHYIWEWFSSYKLGSMSTWYDHKW